MKQENGMPDEQTCRELCLPHQLLCRRGHILSSKLGVTESEFDHNVAESLPFAIIGKRRRYYVSGVIRAFTGK